MPVLRKAPRDLAEVLGRMLAAIPAGAGEGLRRRLCGIGQSVTYAAPETLRMWWFEGSKALEAELPGDPSEFSGWQRDVVATWLGRPFEEFEAAHA